MNRWYASVQYQIPLSAKPRADAADIGRFPMAHLVAGAHQIIARAIGDKAFHRLPSAQNSTRAGLQER